MPHELEPKVPSIILITETEGFLKLTMQARSKQLKQVLSKSGTFSRIAEAYSILSLKSELLRGLSCQFSGSSRCWNHCFTIQRTEVSYWSLLHTRTFAVSSQLSADPCRSFPSRDRLKVCSVIQEREGFLRSFEADITNAITHHEYLSNPHWKM